MRKTHRSYQLEINSNSKFEDFPYACEAVATQLRGFLGFEPGVQNGFYFPPHLFSDLVSSTIISGS
jgi:hypothetical protein